MNNDRELLTLAAKAAGFTDAEWAGEQASICTVQAGKGFRPFWNPLRDDGDALRLAVQLSISFNTAAKSNPFRPEVAYCNCTQHGPTWRYVVGEGPDPYAALRLAIVRAAAEIGRTMP